MAKKNITEKSQRLKKVKELDPIELRWNCPLEIFNFKTSKDLEPLEEIVGQDRAVEAIKLGAELSSKGYNIFVSGLSGTGRQTTVKSILEQVTTVCPITYDYCYVNNFANPDNPRLVKLPRKKGKEFAEAMKEAIIYLRQRLPKLFEEDNFKESRKKIGDEFQQKERDLLASFDEKIRPKGFVRGQLENEQGLVQPEIFPLINGKAVQMEELQELIANKKLSKKKADEISQLWTEYHNELFDLSRAGLKLMQEYRKAMTENDQASSDMIIAAVIADIEGKFPNDQVKVFLKEVKEFILNNLRIFFPPSEAPNVVAAAGEAENQQDFEEAFSIFKVNIVLDNSETETAPVIIETTPNYTNLFGAIERVYDSRGFWKTDFTKIKAGSLLKADQGYIIVNALDLLSEPGVWPSLKRVLLYNKLEVSPFDSYFQMSQTTLKPEPIEINVKVIMIGDSYLYNTLYSMEKDFKKMFKVLAQFDYEADIKEDMLINYARFIRKICDEENLPQCSKEAIGRIIEWAVEFAGSRKKITLKFSTVADVLRESAYFAQSAGNKIISKDDVDKAIKNRYYRNSLIDEKYKENIIFGSVMIDTKGERVGQINGLTVMSTGLISFGKPARITAAVSCGANGIINVEREVDLSGSIHSKGVLIISGLLSERFGRLKTLSLNASLAFEQSYGGIDGDSASAAEMIAVLSAISELPIKQNYAITGSINQKGDIQPIGGINEKIRGFFEICQARGLDGSQGIVMPYQNIEDLMLPEEIVKAVEDELFHIYPVRTIEDAIELMMGRKAGCLTPDGLYYEKDSVFNVVDTKLEEFHDINAGANKQIKGKNKKKSNAIKEEDDEE